MSEDTIYREDAIEAIHSYWKGELSKMPTTDSEYGEVIDGDCDTLLKHNKELSTRIKYIPSADRPSEIIYGNEHNCIMTIFGECSYAETGCGDCAVVEKVRKALSADRLQGEWIDIGGYEVCKNCHEVKRFPHWTFCPNCGCRMKGADDE